MKITVLGCGSSGGVPLIGGNWGACEASNPRNRRTRVSIVVEQGDTTLLVDTSPDLRQQTLDCGIRKIDAVLYTHAHADHCHGIDELRGINWIMQKPIPIYADPVTLATLKRRFDYVFEGSGGGHYYKPVVTAYEINGPFAVGGINVTPMEQDHGYSRSLGFRFGDFAYSTDVHSLSEDNFAALEGIKTWLVDCVRVEPHPTHSHVAQTLAWIERVKPQRAFLTHMNQSFDYDAASALVPPGVWPAHDGLVLEC